LLSFLPQKKKEIGKSNLIFQRKFIYWGKKLVEISGKKEKKRGSVLK
jgi:hypothetical protein